MFLIRLPPFMREAVGIHLHTWMTPVWVLWTGKHTSPFESFFQCPGHQWSRHQSWKMHFCSPLIGNSQQHDFGDSHAAKIESCPAPSGRQAIVMFSQHGKLLPPFFAKLCTVVAPFKPISWRGGPIRWSGLQGTGGFPKCKTPPCRDSTPPTSCCTGRTFSCHWCHRYPYRRRHAAELGGPLAATWFFLQKIDWHGVSLLHVWSWIAHAAIRHFRHFCEVIPFNCGHTTNCSWLHFLMFLPPFRCGSSAFWLSFLNSMCRCCICLVWKMSLVIFCPTGAIWNCRPHNGGRSSWLWNHGRWAKFLCRNAVFAWRFTSRNCVSASRCSMTGWWRFNWSFPPHCPSKIQKSHFFTCTTFPTLGGSLSASCVF
jgi:hypothetical protein